MALGGRLSIVGSITILNILQIETCLTAFCALAVYSLICISAYRHREDQQHGQPGAHVQHATEPGARPDRRHHRGRRAGADAPGCVAAAPPPVSLDNQPTYNPSPPVLPDAPGGLNIDHLLKDLDVGDMDDVPDARP